jgi:predicted aspartyl protease
MWVMRAEQALADVDLEWRDRRSRIKALVDTGASRSVVSKALSDQLGSFIPAERAYEVRTADREGRLRIVGHCIARVTFQGVEVPGEVVFEVAENLREDVQLIMGRPEIDAWDVVFTPEGPKPRKTPIEFEII